MQGARVLQAQSEEQAEKHEASLFLAAFLFLIVIVVGILIVYCIRVRNIGWFPEAWVYFTIGVLVSIIERLSNSNDLSSLADVADNSFDEIFFFMLLPPIIFESGYSMEKRSFFNNFGAICLYAFLGTFLSTIAIAVVLYICGLLPFVYGLSFLEALIFGAIISATDPVTVLAVFQALHVERNLYALVFGESVLNDAVAIVLYHTLLRFQSGFDMWTLFMGTVYFLSTFLGSLVIGSAVGLLSALLFKLTHLNTPEYSGLEKSLVLVLPFLAYMLGEGLQLSGVVAMLFAGITMAHYTIRNLSRGTRKFSLQLFKMLAMVAEGLVFVYIGSATPMLFTWDVLSDWLLLLLAVVACLVGRVVNTELGTWVINKGSLAAGKVGPKSKFVLWFSGLRGGVAFALASAARDALDSKEAGSRLAPMTLFVVVLSMIVIGGGVGPLVRKLDLCEPSDAEYHPVLPPRRRRRSSRRRLQFQANGGQQGGEAPGEPVAEGARAAGAPVGPSGSHTPSPVAGGSNVAAGEATTTAPGSTLRDGDGGDADAADADADADADPDAGESGSLLRGASTEVELRELAPPRRADSSSPRPASGASGSAAAGVTPPPISGRRTSRFSSWVAFDSAVLTPIFIDKTREDEEYPFEPDEPDDSDEADDHAPSAAAPHRPPSGSPPPALPRAATAV